LGRLLIPCRLPFVSRWLTDDQPLLRPAEIELKLPGE